MEKEKEPSTLLHKFNSSRTKNTSSSIVITLLIALILGVGTGYAFAMQKTGNSPKVNKTGDYTNAGKGDVVGTDDTKTFSDKAEGVLQKGGIEGEGQFHLVRPGGESQYVYLVSSIVDLSKFENKKIRVWGQTQKAQKAGWLMDVGRIEVL